jgi:hypothetical protein
LIHRNFLAGILLATGILCSFVAAAVENTSPIEIALFPPLQFPSRDFSVNGLRLSVFGINRSLSGLDLGILGNVTDQSFKGVAIAGLFNYNRVSAEIIGIQVAGIANINGTASKLYGLQLGLYNRVSVVYGLQIGLINVTHELHGIQIGLINFNEAGPFKASPIINAAF